MHLRAELDGFLSGLDKVALREDDPVSIVWNYPDPADREVVALVCACMAYGRVSLLKRAIKTVLRPLGPCPAQSLRDFKPDGPAAQEIQDFVYRMTRGPDVIALFAAIGSALNEVGSLKAVFDHGHHADDSDYQRALTHFVSDLRRRGGSERRGFLYLLADAGKGGACKRLNLFLRWMVRGPDDVDLGLWSDLPTQKLAMPLDTHIVRIARYLGLSSRRTTDWKLAKEIASNLAMLDPIDPLKYDFALCHLGIAGTCPRRRDPACCAQCPIQSVCLL